MVFQIILVLAIIVIGAYVFGIGTDFLDDILAEGKAKIAAQENKLTDPETFENANLAKDTGTRVCDLNITWYGTMWELDPFGFDPFNFAESRFIYIGDIQVPILKGGGPAASDTRTFTYNWECIGTTPTTSISTTTTPTTTPTTTTEEVVNTSTGGDEICRTGARGTLICTTLSFLDLLSWNLDKNTRDGLEELSLLYLGGSLTDRETVTINFIGRSLTQPGKFLQSPELPTLGTPANPFTKSVTLPRGAQLPFAFTIPPTALDDVTEDNYLIEYWIEEYRLNAKAPGTIFNKDLCKPAQNQLLSIVQVNPINPPQVEITC